MASTTKYAELEIALHAGTGIGYQVELRFSHPDSDAEVTPERGTAFLDLDELLSLQTDDRAYGETLTARLFCDDNVKTLYAKARTAVETGGAHLRLRIAVGPEVAALHAVRWELLRDPEARVGAFATSERTPFSRFMVTRDWRHVRPRPRAELRALIAVAAPSGLDRYGLTEEVLYDDEVERVRRALPGIQVRVAAPPVTLERLVAQLRDGVDILYLVCHGTLRRRDGEPFLLLQGEDGGVVRTAGADLAERVAELARPPRLVVLASCESAGTEDGTDASGRPTAQSSLAPRLAAAGVPAILAMQGRISTTTVEKLMPVFFEKLLEDGQIDRALAIARGHVRDRSDSWMPALYLRLKSGRLWNDAGFGGDEVRWENLCGHVQAGKFIPVLGSGIAEKVYLSAPETARRLAHKHGFPLEHHQRADLPRVLQYLSLKEKVTGVVPELKGQLRRQMLEIHDGVLPDDLRGESLPRLMDAVGKLRRQDPDEPHRVLAELRAKVYVTANYDNLLYQALQAAGRTPQRLVTSWREKPPRTTPLEDPPSVEKPALYHLLGFLKNRKSLVLTEDDYFDYLIAASNELIPNEVASPLADSSLLFLGFPLTDWSFRVLFRLILSLEGHGRLRDYPHVAVQVDPEQTELVDAMDARNYLRRYFSKAAEIDVYWGTPEDFLEQLRDKLATLPQETASDLRDDDDDWD